MPQPLTVIIAAAGFLALVGVLGAVLRGAARGPGGDLVSWILWTIIRVYCRLVHRVRYRGREHVPAGNDPGGLIVISNHTGPVDPLLLQAACRFEIRWMMAEEMMAPRLGWLWRRQRVIPVARDGADLAAAREAIRHVRNGGVLGIFPEGGIVRPPGELRPFQEGAGLMIARTRAPVLLAWIRDTPCAEGMLEAMRTPSRAKVDFLGPVDLAGLGDAAAITAAVRQRLAGASGWALNEEPLRRAAVRPEPVPCGP